MGCRVLASPTTTAGSKRCSSRIVRIGTGVCEMETVWPRKRKCGHPFVCNPRHILKLRNTKRPTLQCAHSPPITCLPSCHCCQCRWALKAQGLIRRASMGLPDNDCGFRAQALVPGAQPRPPGPSGAGPRPGPGKSGPGPGQGWPVFLQKKVSFFQKCFKFLSWSENAFFSRTKKGQLKKNN